jgi:GNAT superfamily N-acetyltransferase
VKAAIEIVEFSESLFAPVLAEAPAQGGAFLLRLRDEWADGSLRFDIPGELLLGAFVGSGLVGVGGVSRDPYAPAPGLGRIRHLYVLKSHRGQGIGRALMDRLIKHGRAHFSVLRLSTQAPEAARLYESYGFVRAPAWKQTHRLEF